MIRYNKTKTIIFILLISGYSLVFANYNSRVKQVDQLIQQNMKSIKSSERLDIPEYRGDTLTFERLSKIRNIFNIEHLLPFEKLKSTTKAQPKKEVIKLKPIVIPAQLQKIMDTKPTKLQGYPIKSFKFDGAVYQNNQEWGVVENSMESKPIYLKIGEPIGQDYGQVANITKEGVLVDEWKKDTKKRVWEKVQTVIN